MDSHLFTFEHLGEFIDSRHYLTKERFMHYFTNMYGYNDDSAIFLYDIFQKFPNNMRDEKAREHIQPLLLKCIEIKNIIQGSYVKRPKNIERIYDRDYRKILYCENGSDKVKTMVLDFYNAENIITYAEILKRNPTDVIMLGLNCEVSVPNQIDDNKYLKIFEGDFFDTHDEYWSKKKSNVYLATDTKDTFQKLIYTKGKGYLMRGQPNIDTEEGKKNNYALTLNKYRYMGNIHTDLYLLQDGDGETETKKKSK